VRPGNRVGAYELLRPLGKGGFGTVWQARGERGEIVALKILHRLQDRSRGPTNVERFVAEARLLHDLEHPGVVRVLGVIDARPDGPIAYAMELLDGRDLGSLRGDLDPLALADLFHQTATTLAYLHQRGILHRDVKPQNIFVVRNGAQRIAKLIDFGIAKELDSAGFSERTATGQVLGTMRSMAPETFRKLAGEPVELTPAIDQWALGVALYRMLANAPPFPANTLLPLMEQVVRQPTPTLILAPPFTDDPISDALISVAYRCLEKEPRLRFASMAELATSLAQICEPTHASSYSVSGATEIGFENRSNAIFATNSVAVDPLEPQPLDLELATLSVLPMPSARRSSIPRPNTDPTPARPSPHPFDELRPPRARGPAMTTRRARTFPWLPWAAATLALTLAFLLGWLFGAR